MRYGRLVSARMWLLGFNQRVAPSNCGLASSLSHIMILLLVQLAAYFKSAKSMRCLLLPSCTSALQERPRGTSDWIQDLHPAGSAAECAAGVVYSLRVHQVPEPCATWLSFSNWGTQNGKENGNHYSTLGLYWDNGQENGNYSKLHSACPGFSCFCEWDCEPRDV